MVLTELHEIVKGGCDCWGLELHSIARGNAARGVKHSFRKAFMYQHVTQSIMPAVSMSLNLQRSSIETRSRRWNGGSDLQCSKGSEHNIRFFDTIQACFHL